MKNKLFITVLILSTLSGFSQKDSAVIKEVQQLEQKRFDAQVNKDFSVLEKIFADDLVYVHSNGKIHNKQQYLESIRDGSSQYNKIVQDAELYRVYSHGKTVVVNGSVFITFPPVNDKPNIAHLQYAVVYIKNKGEWRLVTWQSVRLPS